MDEALSAQAIWDEEAAKSGAEKDSPAVLPSDFPATQEAQAPVAAVVETPVVPAEPAKPTTEELLATAIAKIDKLEGRQRNVEGHIGGLTSQQKALSETFTAAQTAAAAVKEAPTQAQVKAAITNPEQWDRLKEDFPEWSDATEKFLDAKLAGLKSGADVATVEKLVAEAIDTATVRITKDVEAKIVDRSLSAVFPGWKGDIKTKEYGDWIATQAQDVQALGDSDEVEDAAKLLSLFNAAKKPSQAQQILTTRKQTLQAAVAAPRGSKPVQAKTPDQMSPEELWNHEAKLRERARAAS